MGVFSLLASLLEVLSMGESFILAGVIELHFGGGGGSDCVTLLIL